MDWRTRTDIKQHIVVLGGGFAGVYTARYLGDLLDRKDGFHVSLVNDENYFVFQPLLPEVAAGTLEPTHLVNPIRHLLPKVDFDCARVERIDLERREIHFQVHEGCLPQPMPFDHLVLALGLLPNLSIIPGMAEHALPMKNLGDAFYLRHHVIRKIEAAANEPDPVRRKAMLTLVVVGGGFSGVETAAELHDAIAQSIRHYPEIGAAEPRVVVVQSGDRILPELSPALSDKARSILEARGVEIVLGSRVLSVTPSAVHLKGRPPLLTETVVCTVGNRPHTLLGGLALPMERGRVLVEPTLQVKGFDSLWAVGDIALIPNRADGKLAPPTAQFAIREARTCAENIRAALKGGRLAEFSHRSQGQFASLGYHNAVAEIPLPVGDLTLRFSGFFAWWMWRTLYLLKLPGFSRKVRVALDWTLDLLFKRDLVGLNVFRTQRARSCHFEPGETVCAQGEVGRTFYVLKAGTAELTTREGEVTRRQQLGPGDHFGDDVLAAGGVRTATVKALTPCDMVTLSQEDFVELTSVLTAMRDALELARRGREVPSLPLAPEVAAFSVRQLMTPSPLTLPPETSLREVVEAFRRERVSGFPIVDGGGALCGLVTRTDLYRALENNLAPETPAHTLMTRSLVTIGPDQRVGEAAQLFRERHLKRLLVVDPAAPTRLLGVVTPSDVFRAASGGAEGALRPALS